MQQGGGDVENPRGSSQNVVVEGGDWSHATMGNKTVHKTVVNTYQQDATGDTFALSPGQFGVTQRIIIYEDDPISPESRIYRAKLLNKLLGDKEIVAKILRAGPRQMREAKIHFTVPHHPNIVERIAADTFKYMGQNCIYIAMEQCDPLNLHAYVRSQIKKKVPFDPQQYISYAYQIALGVEFLHRYDIANRDLKPDNILMSTDKKTVKVCDFGLSKVMEDDREFVTQSAVQPGTDGWRSPELLKDEEKISLATDIYSLALIVVYLWSYGKHAFGDDPHAWNLYIKRGINMRLEIILIPNAIQARGLLKPMLEQDPSKRPTASEVVRHTIFKSLAMVAETHANRLTGAMSTVGLATSAEQRPEGIMMFDKDSKHLQLYNPVDNTLKQMQSFNEDMKKRQFAVVTLDDYIYVLMKNKSVYRLEYSDETATWERMANMIEDHGLFPPATVMSGHIYVMGGSYPTGSNAVEKYEPSSNKWVSINNKKLKTSSCTVVATKGFIYSIGGWSEDGDAISDVERFDPVSSTWNSVSPMQQARYGAAAVEFDGKIFVLGGYVKGKMSSCEYFDPSTNVWSLMKTKMLEPRSVFNAFEINGKIYVVGGDRKNESIERYNTDGDFWEEVQLPKKLQIVYYGSTKVKISTKTI